MKVTLTAADQRALWDECEHQWERLRKQFWRVYLPSQEWEDIRSEAFSRVLRKAARHFNPAKGAVDTWVGTVMRRAMMNEFRRLLPSIPAHKARTSLLNAGPIVQRLARTRWGDEHVLVKPDRVAPASKLGEVEEFRGMLGESEQRAVDLLLAGHGISSVKRRLRLRDWCAANQLVRSLGDRWEVYQSTGGRKVTPTAVGVPERLPDDVRAVLAAIRAMPKTGEGRRQRKERCRKIKRAERQAKRRTPSHAWLRKRLAQGLTRDEWNRLRELWADLPAFDAMAT